VSTADALALFVASLAEGGALIAAVFGFVAGLELVHFAVDLVRGE
jgi:hypothetical protein